MTPPRQGSGPASRARRRLLTESAMMPLATTSGSSSSTGASAVTTSSFISASMAARKGGSASTWPSVGAAGAPTCVARASMRGRVSRVRRRSSTATCPAVVGRSSAPPMAWRTRPTCFPASIRRARKRSSLAVRRLTRPISRRYMRTGSSIISADCRSRFPSSSFCLVVSGPSDSPWGPVPQAAATSGSVRGSRPLREASLMDSSRETPLPARMPRRSSAPTSCATSRAFSAGR